MLFKGSELVFNEQSKQKSLHKAECAADLPCHIQMEPLSQKIGTKSKLGIWSLFAS